MKINLKMNGDIAIVGAGFCGLAIAWHLLNQPPPFPRLNIRLFDSKEIGGGTSGIAAGLLHPYVGAHAKLNWMGREGLQATSTLLKVASQALGKSVTAQDRGILRLALTEEQQQDYRQCAMRYPQDIEWLDPHRCQALIPSCAHAPGIWIKRGLTVYSSLYLQGLWLACKQQGATFEQRFIPSLEELQSFSVVILAVGAATQGLPELSHLPIQVVKGQVLELAWPSSLPPLPCALNSHAYALMTPSHHSCLVGATYEREWSTIHSDVDSAREAILPKAAAMLPHLKELPLVGCYAGLRASTPNHLPLIAQLNSQQWVLTGMGSKGLLYHALMAQHLVKRIREAHFL